MKIKHEIVLVQGENYQGLAINIQDEINDREDTKEVQAIDYFGMRDDDGLTCSAFILFKPKI